MIRYDQAILISFFLVAMIIAILAVVIPGEIKEMQYFGLGTIIIGCALIIFSKWNESFTKNWSKLGPPRSSQMKRYYKIGYFILIAGIAVISIRY